MKNHWRTVTVLLLWVASVDPAPAALAPTSLYDGRVHLQLPDDFRPMSREALLRKYTRPNPPTLVYANAAATVSIVIEHTPLPLKAHELDEAFPHIKAGFEQVALPTDWYRSEITTINGRRFFLMDLRTPSADGTVRNLMIGTSLDDRLLMISFNTTVALEEQWMPIAQQIIQSVRLK